MLKKPAPQFALRSFTSLSENHPDDALAPTLRRRPSGPQLLAPHHRVLRVPRGLFRKHFGRSPEQLGPEEVHAYQVYLVREKKASWCSFNQAVCALRFLYRTTLPRPWPVAMIPFAKRPKKLPTVLGPEEVQRLLACATPLKQRLVLTTIYAAGLRLLEAMHLQPADIDSSRMLLRVACGKGAKERVVPLSPRLLTELREYWRMYRPTTWLFPGPKSEQPLALTTIQNAAPARRSRRA